MVRHFASVPGAINLSPTKQLRLWQNHWWARALRDGGLNPLPYIFFSTPIEILSFLQPCLSKFTSTVIHLIALQRRLMASPVLFVFLFLQWHLQTNVSYWLLQLCDKSEQNRKNWCWRYSEGHSQPTISTKRGPKACHWCQIAARVV